MNTLKREIPEKIRYWLKRDPELQTISGLTRKIGYEDCKMHVYRVLGSQNKHKHFVAPLKLCGALCILNPDGTPNIDEFARQVLDYPKGRVKNWIQKQMINSGISSQRQLAIRAGVESTTAHNFCNGEVQYIQMGIYRDIAHGLNVTLFDLLLVLFQGKPEVKLLQARHVVGNLDTPDERDHLLISHKTCIYNNHSLILQLIA